MLGVFLGQGVYTYKGIEYIQSIPRKIPDEDLAFISAIGKFQLFPDEFEFPEGFAFKNQVFVIPPKAELDENFAGKNILIKRLGGLGDVIGTLSVCELIKSKASSTKITLACDPWVIPIVKLFSCVDEVIPYSESKKIEKFSRFDYMLDFIYTIEQNEQRRHTDYYDLYKNKAKVFEKDQVILPKITLKYGDAISQWLTQQGLCENQYIILHVGGTADFRRWGNERWQRLAYEITEYTDYSVVVTGGEYDFSFEDKQNRIFTAIGVGIDYIPDIVKRSRLVITTDTGMIHIAGILEKETIGLWGTTSPSSVVSYYKNQKAVIGKCEHSPCFALRKSECPHHTTISDCMKVIRIENVKEMLGQCGVEFKQKKKPVVEEITEKIELKPRMISTVFGDTSIALDEVVLNPSETNILYITQSEFKAYTGGRYYGWLNAKMLAEMGFHVWVLTNALPPFFQDFTSPSFSGKFSVIVDPEINPLKFNCKFDYVIGEPYNTGEPAYLYGQKMGVPIVNYIYETPNYIKEYREGDDIKEEFWVKHKNAMINSDMILVLSEIGKQKLYDWDEKFKEKKVFVLTPSINEKEYHGEDIKVQAKKIKKYDFVFVSINKNYKNLPFIVYGFEQLSLRLDVPLNVALIGHRVGRACAGKDTEKLKFHVFENCSDRTKFSVINQSNVMVCPSKFEGFGISMIEGLFSNCALICADLPVTRENLGTLPIYYEKDNIDEFILRAKEQHDFFTKDRSSHDNFIHPRALYARKCSSLYKEKYSNEVLKHKLSEIFTLKKPLESFAISDPKKFCLGVLTPYNEQCGIAENTRYYQEHFNFLYHVLAPTGGRLTEPDKENVHRCWDRKFNSYSGLLQTILNLGINLLHIQHEFSFFAGRDGVQNLYKFLKDLRNHGIKTIITYHTYFLNNGVHSTLNMLTDWATVCNVEAEKLIKKDCPDAKISCIPLPILYYPWKHRLEARKLISEIEFKEDDFIIGTHGFWQPHKGYHLLIDALNMIKNTTKAKLMIIGSYSSGNDYNLRVKSAIRSYGLEDRVILVNGFLSMDKIIQLLQCCNLVIYNYLIDGYYSSSAAIRTGLSAHVPIISSDSPMFADLKNVVKMVPMGNIKMLAEQISALESTNTPTGHFCQLWLKSQDSYGKTHTPQEIADKYRKLYSSIMKGAVVL